MTGTIILTDARLFPVEAYCQRYPKVIGDQGVSSSDQIGLALYIRAQASHPSFTTRRGDAYGHRLQSGLARITKLGLFRPPVTTDTNGEMTINPLPPRECPLIVFYFGEGGESIDIMALACKCPRSDSSHCLLFPLPIVSQWPRSPIFLYGK